MKDKRTAEFVLGLIGGIFGIIAGVMAMGIGGLGAALGTEGARTVGNLGVGAIVLSIVGIVGSILVKTKGKIGGLLMTIAAVGGVICISAFYILPGILLIIPGLMGLIKKDQKKINSETEVNS